MAKINIVLMALGYGSRSHSSFKTMISSKLAMLSSRSIIHNIDVNNTLTLMLLIEIFIIE